VHSGENELTGQINPFQYCSPLNYPVESGGGQEVELYVQAMFENNVGLQEVL
jgi:hypothetical protein